MSMRNKALILIWVLLMNLISSTVGSVTYAQESISLGNYEKDSSYYLIQFNGEDPQRIDLNDTISLDLSGWSDESKTSVYASISQVTDSSTSLNDQVVLEVTEELQELNVADTETIHYRIVPSTSTEVEIVKPLELKQQDSVFISNENGTSIVESLIVDEYGTILESKDLLYYLTNELNQKIEISKEEYENLNLLKEQTENEEIATVQTEQPVFSTQASYGGYIDYSTHVQDIGWQSTVSEWMVSGTEGQGKRLEAIKISLKNTPYSGGVTYRTHVESYGWLGNVSNGAASGTEGQSKRLEAIQISLTGDMDKYYDIYYRVHAQDYGWLDWAKNGMLSGTEGLSKRLEAIQIVLVNKGGAAPGSTERPFVTKTSVVYSTHVEDYGWMNPVKNGELSGTEGQSKRLEAIQIRVQDVGYSAGITYTTHVQDYGWLSNSSNGEMSGTSGQSKRLEAITINLNGEIANFYDVYYRVHIESYGWLGWAKNGMKAGSQGLSKRLEGIEIKLVPKGQGQSVNENSSFKQLVTVRSVFIDPGHGGYDPGATSGGYEEADLNLAVSKKVEALLVARGYKVYMSRTSDTSLTLLERSQMANNINADIFISIHHNSTGTATTSANGIESFYYEYNPENPSKINEAMHNNPDRIIKSMALTNLVQQNMIEYTGAYNRGTDGSSFSVVRESAMPATLLELGFINNPTERQKLITDSYQNTLATAIADGIVEYFRMY